MSGYVYINISIHDVSLLQTIEIIGPYFDYCLEYVQTVSAHDKVYIPLGLHKWNDTAYVDFAPTYTALTQTTTPKVSINNLFQ